MNIQENSLVKTSRPPPLAHLPSSQSLSPRDAISLLEAVCGQGERVQLRSQQRLPLPSAGATIVLREGVLAIDAMPAKGKLQILDFLVPGDVVSASIGLCPRRVSLRAITKASLVFLDPKAIDFNVAAHDYWSFLFARCQNQLARVNIHQLMIGRLETESRVASFLLALALRNKSGGVHDLNVALPMSRTDIANYLVINSDTLSRVMMRFTMLGLIERANRHAVRIIDIDKLRKASPIAALLSAVFEPGDSQRESRFAQNARSEYIFAVQSGQSWRSWAKRAKNWHVVACDFRAPLCFAGLMLNSLGEDNVWNCRVFRPRTGRCSNAGCVKAA